MFKINPNPTFTEKVALSVPGEADPAVIDIEFRHKGRTAFAAWWSGIPSLSLPVPPLKEGEAAPADPPTPPPVRSDADILDEVMVSWNGPLDDKGAPVPYSREALIQLLDHYHAATMEIFTAYRRGLMESRAKNSKALPAI